MNQPPKPSPWLLTIIIIILAVGGLLAWVYFSNNITQTAPATTGTTPSSGQTAAQLATADCDKYTNEKYDLTIYYPKSYKYEEKTASGALLEVVFTNNTLGDDYQVTVTVADLKSSVEPSGMKSTLTKDVLMAGKTGKNFDDIAYVVDGEKYRYRVTVKSDADSTLKVMAKAMAKAVQFTSAIAAAAAPAAAATTPASSAPTTTTPTTTTPATPTP